MVTGPGFLASPAAASPGPTHVPLFRALEAKSGMGLRYPLVKMSRPEIFSKNHSRGITPRMMGPEPKNFKTIFDRGITQMDRLIDTP